MHLWHKQTCQPRTQLFMSVPGTGTGTQAAVDTMDGIALTEKNEKFN